MPIPYQNLSGRSEVFALDWGPDQPILYFAVDALLAHLEETAEIVGLEVNDSLVSQLERNGVEEDHLERLDAAGAGHKPLVIIIDDLGKGYVVDGNHAAVRMIQCGHDVLPGYLVQPAVWREFLIQDVPWSDDQYRGIAGDLPEVHSRLLGRS